MCCRWASFRPLLSPVALSVSNAMRMTANPGLPVLAIGFHEIGISISTGPGLRRRNRSGQPLPSRGSMPCAPSVPFAGELPSGGFCCKRTAFDSQ
ncbi:hypothetical protein F4802DRAFT_150113 [Xylaria palmicola]|nr:hypothetical protein F4802DRAFT_150113 [Xylaria palmicola]